MADVKGGEKTGGMQFRIVILPVLAVLTLILFWMTQQESTNDTEYLTLLGEQLVLSQSISKNALEAATGDSAAFDRLKRQSETFEKNHKLVKEGGGNVKGQLASLEKVKAVYKENADAILTRQDAIVELNNSVAEIYNNLPNLLALADEVVSILIETGATPHEVYIASRQLMLTQRIANNVRRVTLGGEGSATAADRFGRDTALFGRVLAGMLNGDNRMRIPRIADEDARDKLTEVSEVFNNISSLIGKVLQASPELFAVHDGADTISAASGEMLGALSAVRDVYREGIADRLMPVAAMAMGLFTLYALAYLIFTVVRDTRISAAKAQKESAESQEAILTLMNEMADLAAGDLTVQATVSENITGAIADSINYVVEELRKLVASINEASVQVSSASQETQATARHLAEASDQQAQQITEASTSINQMAVAIDEVSRSAEESAKVADQSVATAQKGAETVQNTIVGMDTIREQIQETSKRIKRLGESSQEIGDIVSLITDIADQTNILALNAAIQAAMAGEAGRGFAVVADEVQRLAERSGNATKQIEALVKTIQTDTNEAVISMEQSTTNVVNGAKLALEAGQALGEIEDVSNKMAELIRGISSTSQQQASAANSVSETMNTIQEITTQTSAGTNETATSIGNIAELANELRKSVAGFKLPQ